jgi:hypothetical protein
MVDCRWRVADRRTPQSQIACIFLVDNIGFDKNIHMACICPPPDLVGHLITASWVDRVVAATGRGDARMNRDGAAAVRQAICQYSVFMQVSELVGYSPTLQGKQ